MNVVYPRRNPFPRQGASSMEERVDDDALIHWEENEPTAQLPAVHRLLSITQRYLHDFAAGRLDQGQVAFLHGDHGSGKTHAVRHVLGQLGGETDNAPYRLYVKAQDGDFLASYRRLMSQLSAPVLRDLSLRFLGTLAADEATRLHGTETGEAAAAALATEPGRLTEMLEQLLVERGAVLQAQARELTQITGDQEDFQRALTSLLDPLLEEAAYDWLVGREIAQVDAQRLGVAGPITDPELCRYGIQLIVALCTRSGRPIVVILDQCERLMLDEDGGFGRRNEGLLHSLVERIPRESGMLVLVGNEQVWDWLPQDLKQRFGDNAVNASVVDLVQATDLVAAYLRAVTGPRHGIYPFTPNAIRAMLESSDGNIRALLQLCWRVLEWASPTRGLITRRSVKDVISDRARPPDPQLSGLREGLAVALDDLDGSSRLSVIEIHVHGITVSDLYRDEAGTPRGRSRQALLWSDVDTAALEQAIEVTVDRSFTVDVLLVCSAPGFRPADLATDLLRVERPEAMYFVAPDKPVDELLREVISDDPLRTGYELVVLEARPGGRLNLSTMPLFPAGARRGDMATRAVWSRSPDEAGMVFAVVTWLDSMPRLVDAQRAELEPGRHEFTAELVRPGRVGFRGLPADPVPEERSWQDLVAAVPHRTGSSLAMAHVIFAVEYSGLAVQVEERLAVVRKIINAISEEPPVRLQVSLITYGAHSFDWKTADPAVEVRTWQGSAEQAWRALLVLRPGSVDRGYPHGAQVEDMLKVLNGLLEGAETSECPTVLLVVGDRPPHPTRADFTEILPCPRRLDWESLLRSVERRPQLKMSAICTEPHRQTHPVWSRLSAGHSLHRLDELDARSLLAGLGLTSPSAVRLCLPTAEVHDGL